LRRRATLLRSSNVWKVFGASNNLHRSVQILTPVCPRAENSRTAERSAGTISLHTEPAGRRRPTTGKAGMAFAYPMEHSTSNGTAASAFELGPSNRGGNRHARFMDAIAANDWQRRARDFMQPKYPVLRETDPLKESWRCMQGDEFYLVPVVRAGQLVGIVTSGSVRSWATSHGGRLRRYSQAP
jgi:hypothetical protein